MKLFCRCNAEWITPVLDGKGCNETRQVISDIPVGSCCDTADYWYDADYENMMFDLKRMNQC